MGVCPLLMDHSINQKEISIQICYKVSWFSSFVSIWGKDTEPEQLDEFGMYVGIFRGRIGHLSSSFPLCISLNSQNRWVGQTTRWLQRRLLETVADFLYIICKHFEFWVIWNLWDNAGINGNFRHPPHWNIMQLFLIWWCIWELTAEVSWQKTGVQSRPAQMAILKVECLASRHLENETLVCSLVKRT